MTKLCTENTRHLRLCKFFLQGFEAIFERQPLFKLRLTSLGGDGACVLTASASHVVCGGAQVASLLVDLASACRGEPLQPLPKGLSRDLFTPNGLGEAVPFLKPLLEEVVAASQGEVLLLLHRMHTLSLYSLRCFLRALH